MQTLLAVLFCGIAAAVSGGFDDVVRVGSPRMFVALLYAAIGCTIAGYMLQNVALAHISAKQVGFAQCLYPIATALIACFVLKEKLSLAGTVGACMITLCVLLENRLSE